MKSLFSSSDARQIRGLLVALWLVLAWTAPAAQVKLDSLVVRGRSYTNVTVLSYNTTHVFFTYPGGSASVKLRDLEPNLQERFNYDPSVAAEAEKQQAADEVRYRESIAANIAADFAAQAQQAALAARRVAATSADNLADPVSDKSLIGKPAPAIEGGKWLGEKPTLEGKVVLVVFWAPWSIPCRKYIPVLDGLQKKFAGKLAVVGVTSESEAEVTDMTEPKIGFATMLDADAKFSVSVGVTSIPYVMLVDPKGIVRYQGHPAAITEKKVEGILEKPAE
jgi:cytochrome c biogenesis protein CcmG, thiol:disulfide interchange protein DsbE